MSHSIGEYVKYVSYGTITHVGKVVALDQDRGMAYGPMMEIEGFFGHKPATWYHPMSKPDLPLLTLEDMRLYYPELLTTTTVSPVTDPAKHRAGLDPEVIDWDAHKAFLRGD